MLSDTQSKDEQEAVQRHQEKIKKKVSVGIWPQSLGLQASLAYLQVDIGPGTWAKLFFLISGDYPTPVGSFSEISSFMVRKIEEMLLFKKFLI